MASLLKLIVDFPCQVYIDNELKGSVEKDKIYKLPLRKGTYILELKYADILLYEQEYKMESNEEEDLLRINIKEEDKKVAKEKQFWEISSMDVSIKEDGEDGLYLLNNKTGEKYIIDLYNDPLSYNVYYSKEFDACGLLKVTLYRDGFNSNYTALVNKVGKIQIGGYSNIAPFNNEQITVACKTSKDPFGERPVRNTYYLIDKWGNHKNLKYDYLDMDGFIGNCCIVGKNTRDEFGQIGTRYGLIDRKGELVLECDNWEIEPLISLRSKRVFVVKFLVNESKILDGDGKVVYEDGPHSIEYYYYTGKDSQGDIINQDFRFIIEKNGKYGIQDFVCNTLLDFEYDSIKRIGDSSYLSYVKDGVIGFFDPKLHNIPIDFEFVDTIEEGLIRKKNKYGMIEISIESDTLRFKEVIPCKYDVYKECRHVCSAPYTYFFMKKQKDDLYLCDAFYTEKNNSDGAIKKVKSFICQDIDEEQSDNNSFVVKNNDKWGIVDKIECKYDEIKKGFGVDTLIKENGKWGILYRTDCIYDKILYAFYGRYAVIWSEKDKKYIGYIDKVGIYKREVDKSEVLVDFGIFANEKPVIFTVVVDENIDPKNNYYGVPRKVYVCRKAVNCNKPEELMSIDYALTCNKIWSLSNGNDGVKEDEVGVEIKINGRHFFHDHVYGVFSFKTLSFVEECDNIWGAYDSEWYIKYNQLSGKEVLYYKSKLVSENDYIMVVYSKGFDNSIIAEQSEGSKWALFDENHIQLSMPIFTEFDVDEEFNINRLSFNKSKKDISHWEFFISDLSKIRYVFPFFKYRFHDGRGNSKDISPFKNIRTFIDVLPRTVIAEPTNSALIEKSTIDRVALIVEDDNIGMLTMREFIVGDGDGVKNQMNNKAFKQEIISNKTYEDFISYLDIMLEESDYIIGVNTNNVLETIRKDIKRVKGASDSLYNGKNTDVLDLGRIKDLRMFETQKEINMIDWVNKIRECYNK